MDTTHEYDDSISGWVRKDIIDSERALLVKSHSEEQLVFDKQAFRVFQQQMNVLDTQDALP